MQIGFKLLAHLGRGHLSDQCLTLGQGVVAESLGLDNLLARQQAVGIGSEALDEVLARRELINASAQKIVNCPVISCCLATLIPSTCSASSRVGAPHKAGRRRAMRAASCVWPTPWRLATPKSDSIASELIGKPT